MQAAPEEASYELPDGNVLRLRGLRMAIPELMFSADMPDVCVAALLLAVPQLTAADSRQPAAGR